MRRRIVSAGPGLSAWMRSCLLHAAILAACIPLFRSVPKDSSESFLWTISLIGSPDSAPEETGLPEPPTGHEPSQAIVAKSPDMAPSQPAPAALSTPAPPPQAAPPSEAPAAAPPPAVPSDQEALSLVQRAFPLILDRAIDRPQIVMRIPIIYARD